MATPRVLCVCLCADRPQFIARSLASFRSQTYENKVLYFLDNGKQPAGIDARNGIFYGYTEPGKSIGALRNLANCMAIPLECDVIAHWDSDDWSHPERISEQVKLLQESGKQAVGYREVLFWETEDSDPVCHCGIELSKHSVYDNHSFTEMECPGEAWLYSSPNPNYCIGSSLCYWRETWAKKPFLDMSAGEDLTFWTGIKAAAVTSGMFGTKLHSIIEAAEPRMVCAIHGGNTTSKIDAGKREWRRVPEWDAICRERMAL